MGVTSGGWAWDESYSAVGDLSTKQFYCVERAGNGSAGVSLANSVTDRPVGILQNKPTSGQAATVRLLGRSRAVVDGSSTAIVAGDILGPDASGRLIKAATDTRYVLAVAEQAAGAAGVVIDVTLTGGYTLSV